MTGATTGTEASTEASTGSAPLPDAITPGAGTVLRRSLFWVGVAVVALAVAVFSLIASGSAETTGPELGAANPAPAGGRAVVEVLRQQGVTVTTAGTLAEAKAAVAEAGADDSTLLVFDPDGLLDADRLDALDGLAAATVVVAPDFRALRSLAPGVGFGGTSSGILDAECTPGPAVPAATRAGSVGRSLRTLSIAGVGEAEAASYTACFRDSRGASRDGYALVQRTSGSSTVTLLGDAAPLRNDTVTTAGNAALALNLLGGHDTLVWYLPTIADVTRTGPPSLAELTPGWALPVAGLLVVTAIAAALWRGRRFGPLVVENLPVVVRASETMEGRARLYARSSSRRHALDALRIGAIRRIASRLGLAATASVDEVIGSTAAATRHPLGEVRELLLDADPAGDRELVDLSDRLAGLERDVAAATRAPDQTPDTTATDGGTPR